MSIVVKWGRERIMLPLPPLDTKLQLIRRSLADYTQLPEHSLKLIHSGAVMKGDGPISAYNIRENSVIVLIAGGELPEVPLSTKPNTADRKTEQSTISQIRSELDQVRKTLSPAVDLFLHTLFSRDPLPRPEEQPSSDTDNTRTLEKERTRLAELLLQSLLRLDAIMTDGGWEEARAERKGAVKEVQGLLDRLDGGWTSRPARYLQL